MVTFSRNKTFSEQLVTDVLSVTEEVSSAKSKYTVVMLCFS